MAASSSPSPKSCSSSSESASSPKRITPTRSKWGTNRLKSQPSRGTAVVFRGGGTSSFMPNRLEPYVLLLAGITLLLVWFQDWTLIPSSTPVVGDELGYTSSSSSTSLLFQSPPVDHIRISSSSSSKSSSLRKKTSTKSDKNMERDPSTTRNADLDSTDSMDPADKPVLESTLKEEQDKASRAADVAVQAAASAAQVAGKATPSMNRNGEKDHGGEPAKLSKEKVSQDQKPTSPYEQRWPTYRLPIWASKSSYFRRSVSKDDGSSNSVCFVHVGKAAGSSVGCSLGFQLHCSSEYVYPPGKLPSSTTNIMHNDVNDCALDMDYYMFTMRHPVERIKSWFLYDWKMLGPLRHDDDGCRFHTLNQLAEIGLAPYPNPHTSRDCHKLAVRVIRGEEKIGNHAYHNYRYYLNQVPSNATITVIRAEHMLDDWNAMERILETHHPQVVDKLPSKNENKQYQPEDKFVSETGLKYLCAALCDEIQVYKYILHRASNLSQDQVNESIDELRKTCPIQVDQAGCPR